MILLLKNMRLKPPQPIPYLISGALIATASNALSLWMHILMTLSLQHRVIIYVLFDVYPYEEKLSVTLPNSLINIEESFFTKNFHPLKAVTALLYNSNYSILNNKKNPQMESLTSVKPSIKVLVYY